MGMEDATLLRLAYIAEHHDAGLRAMLTPRLLASNLQQLP
jgi:hypothetical protein